jgi:hypothetical protein
MVIGNWSFDFSLLTEYSYIDLVENTLYNLVDLHNTENNTDGHYNTDRSRLRY